MGWRESDGKMKACLENMRSNPRTHEKERKKEKRHGAGKSYSPGSKEPEKTGIQGSLSSTPSQLICRVTGQREILSQKPKQIVPEKQHPRLSSAPPTRKCTWKIRIDGETEAKTNKSFAKITKQHQEPTGGKSRLALKPPPKQTVDLQVWYVSPIGYWLHPHNP